MEAALLGAARWLDAAGVGDWSRAATWVYPTANSVHLLGLVLLVGGIGVVDLRVAGLWRSLPLPALSRALTPFAISGLILLVLTGIVLFAADGHALARSAVFQRKLVLVALALANAAMFRLLWQRGIDRGGRVPTAARLMAAASLLLWLLVGLSGRWIAYS